MRATESVTLLSEDFTPLETPEQLRLLADAIAEAMQHGYAVAKLSMTTKPVSITDKQERHSIAILLRREAKYDQEFSAELERYRLFKEDRLEVDDDKPFGPNDIDMPLPPTKPKRTSPRPPRPTPHEMEMRS